VVRRRRRIRADTSKADPAPFEIEYLSGEAVTTSSATSNRTDRKSKGGLLSRVRLFVRQVISELRKVVRPTRNELLTYTTVVLIFVLAVMTFVFGLDFAFGKLVLWVFGG
jgi:preprotein translocase subunit SecE